MGGRRGEGRTREHEEKWKQFSNLWMGRGKLWMSDKDISLSDIIRVPQGTVVGWGYWVASKEIIDFLFH